jgi:hypothetical protein
MNAITYILRVGKGKKGDQRDDRHLPNMITYSLRVEGEGNIRKIIRTSPS